MNAFKKLLICLVLIFFVSCSSFFGPNNPEDLVSTPGLIITEVGNNVFVGTSVWIEIYNPLNEAINLTDYRLRCASVNLDIFDDNLYFREFDLPARIIPSGGFIIIRGDPRDDRTDSDQIVFINEIENRDTYIPFINGDGSFYFELIVGDKTSDFVKNGWEITPLTGAFSGDAPAITIANDRDYGRSVARNRAFFDSDSGSDWSKVAVSTPGGFNDVTNSTDNDQDGIPDANESPGSTFAGLPLYEWGARPNVRDIFIHIDYMSNLNVGIIPKRQSLDLVVAAFTNEKIKIHFDVGDLFHQGPGISPSHHDLSDANHQVPFREKISLFTSSDSSPDLLYDYKARHMPINRKQIFHYSLFAKAQESAPGTGVTLGRAELYGNDMIISLGPISTINAPETYLINYQASVLMHELGHNLGLLHGGDANTNYKPNYYSVMNYLYSFLGVPHREGAIQERYLLNDFASMLDLIDGPLSEAFKIDYSYGTSIPLNETNLNESLGIGRGLGPVDWNTNGNSSDNNLSFNINPSSNEDIRKDTLTDYNDWNNLYFTFYRTFSGDTDIRLANTETIPTVHYSKVISERDDRSQKWLEPCVIPFHHFITNNFD